MTRARTRAGILACCGFALAMMLAPASAESAPALEMLWRAKADGRLEWRTFDSAGKPLASKQIPESPTNEAAERGIAEPFEQRAPLGSLWKLFVYLWLVEQRHPAPDYVCAGARNNPPNAREHLEEEAYCCDVGQGIGRELALVRSCGLFFEPRRLGISPEAWRTFWEARPGVLAAAPWLADLGAMKPETLVSPASILRALEAAPTRARLEATNTLLARLFAFSPGLEATGLVRGMGGRLRIKTFSWHRPGQPKRRYGGGAGWLIDGRPVWFAGEGSGQQVMARYGSHLAKALAETLPPDAGTTLPGCVRVNFFARYPFDVELPGGKAAQEGVLHGRFIARFRSGVSIPFASSGELALSQADGQTRIEGRFGIDDYVARVIEREADPRETEAARALAVVIRSYLLNEAAKQGNCLNIDDSSRKQRVSILQPGSKARAAAGFTTGLALHGAPVGYHSTTPSKNRLAWTEAVAASQRGETWDAILLKAFPKSNLGAMDDPAGIACQRFAEAENWLAARAPQWHRALYAHLPGFEPSPTLPDICLLPYGLPFSEQDRGRIHIRGLRSAEDRITLAHEYLHIGLRHHPSGHDEKLIEHWARKLVDEVMP